MKDFAFINQGTLIQIVPKNDNATKWLKENLQTESWQWFGNTLCVEPRYAEGIEEMIEDSYEEVLEV
jgi:hypothetical protein